MGRLLFEFQLGINYNQHGVYRAEGRVEAGKKLPLVDVGAAFYPNILLLNHSCCPNTLKINQGRKLFLLAKHSIKKGQEVTDCYGQHHLSAGRAARAEILTKAFMFSCNCPACRQDWPSLERLEARLSQADLGKLGNNLSKYQVSQLYF